MTSQSLVDRLLSPAGFGLVLLMFLLPFVTVSCSTEVVDDPAAGSSLVAGGPVTLDVDFTGVDLLTGASPDISLTAPMADGTPQTVLLPDEDAAELERQFGAYHPVQPLVVIAAVVLFAGMVLTLVLPLRRSVPIGAAGALAAIVLLTVQVAAVSPRLASRAYAEQADAEALAGLDVTMRTVPSFGFYSAVAVLLAVLVRQFMVARRPPAPPSDSDEQTSPVSDHT